MHLRSFGLILLATILLSIPCCAERDCDSHALAVLHRMQANAGWTRPNVPNDVVLVGVITRYDQQGNVASTGTITVKVRGTTGYSEEITFGSKVVKATVLNQFGAIHIGGRHIGVTPRAIITPYVPFFTDLAAPDEESLNCAIEADEPTMSTKVRIWRADPNKKESRDELRRGSPLDVTILSDSNLPAAIRYNRAGTTNYLSFSTLTRKFSDYRRVRGIAVPFAHEEWDGNDKLYSIQFDSVTFNVGLTDADFGGRQ